MDKGKTGDILKGFFKSKTGRQIVTVVLVALAAVLLLWDFTPDTRKNPETAEGETLTAEEYEQALEQRLSRLLSALSGVGECQVAVTVENSGEVFYVTQGKEEQEREQKADGTGSDRHQKEESYIVMENEAGETWALSRKTHRPTVCGVAVVCQGGSSPAVREQVIIAVSTLLNIGTDRVWVGESD